MLNQIECVDVLQLDHSVRNTYELCTDSLHLQNTLCFVHNMCVVTVLMVQLFTMGEAYGLCLGEGSEGVPASHMEGRGGSSEFACVRACVWCVCVCVCASVCVKSTYSRG